MNVFEELDIFTRTDLSKTTDWLTGSVAGNSLPSLGQGSRSALLPEQISPSFDYKEGCHLVSCWKNSSTSTPLTWAAINSWANSFLSLFNSFFDFTIVLRRDWFPDENNSLSFVNWCIYISLNSLLWIPLIDFTILGPITSLVSSWINLHSSLLIMNKLPIFFISVTRQPTWVLKLFWNATVFSWWLYLIFLCCFKTEFHSNSIIILRTSGPQTILFLGLPSSSVRSVAPPSPFRGLLSCSWH